MQSYLKPFGPTRTQKIRGNLINDGFYKPFWETCIHGDVILAVDCPCPRCRRQFRSSRCGRTSLPSPGLRVREGFDCFPCGSEMEWTNPAGSMENELVQTCKALSELETLRKRQSSTQLIPLETSRLLRYLLWPRTTWTDSMLLY